MIHDGTIIGDFSEKDKSSVEGLGWLPILIVCTYFVSFSIGSGPVPWLMVGEIFPAEIKGTAAALSACINWLLAFIVTRYITWYFFSRRELNFNFCDRFYSDLVYAVNVSTTFWIFTVLLLLGLVFVVFALPETRGKSLEEIQTELGGGPPITADEENNSNSHRRHNYHNRHNSHHHSKHSKDGER